MLSKGDICTFWGWYLYSLGVLLCYFRGAVSCIFGVCVGFGWVSVGLLAYCGCIKLYFGLSGLCLVFVVTCLLVCVTFGTWVWGLGFGFF